MKRQKYYTLIFFSNSTGAVRKIHFHQKTLKIFLGGAVGLFATLILFLTDYFGLAVQQMEIHRLRSKNQKWKEKFALVETEFQELRQEVFQLMDFNRKVHLIANLGVLHDNPHHLSYGKTSSSSHLIQLSRPDSKPFSPSRLPAEKQRECTEPSFSIADIKDLKVKSQLVKQDTWEIYSSLLEHRTLLSGTPSILPVQGGWITSHYGFRNETIYADHDPQFHNGMDIAARAGNPVVATANGCIQFTGYDENGYGKLVVINHGSDVTTYYAHLSEIRTKIGQCVRRGEVIGAVGNTGKSTGPHLHYEVRVLGTPVNPRHYILDENPVSGLTVFATGGQTALYSPLYR